MKSLRRTAVGCFSIKDAKGIDEIEQKDILEVESVMKRLGEKSVSLKERDDITTKIRNGNPVYMFMVSKHDKLEADDRVGIFSGNKLIAVGITLLDSSRWVKKKPLVKTDRVLKD